MKRKILLNTDILNILQKTKQCPEPEAKASHTEEIVQTSCIFWLSSGNL